MFRIGIFGAENSHAHAFSKMFNGTDPAFPDLQVVAVGGEDPEACAKIQSECDVLQIARTPRDMLGKIDAAMVTSRDGKLHLGYAKTFIEAGLPTFVDKPITTRQDEAQALIDLAREKKVPLIGGSSVKLLAPVQELRRIRETKAREVYGGYVFAPVSMENPYSGFYFYSAHLVETAMEIFGMNPLSVTAGRNERGVICTLRYMEYDIALQFMEGVYRYGAVLHLKDETISREIDLDDCYRLEGEHYAHMLRTGDMPVTYENMIRNVSVLNAIEAAYTTGAMVPIQ